LALDTMGSEHARAELRSLKRSLHQRGEPAPAALRQGLALLLHSDLRGALDQLAIPSLWLSGRRDRLVPPAAMAEAARIARGEHVDIAGGGHAPFLGHAAQVAAALAAFAERALRAGQDRA
ncbi:MAG TPA: pimeloyl-[acyl-carrier protein] methyl ester esterase, partial [Pseudoxanthomonas sp.]|nr:pimeloyl-[acyl-carrier protein] methyl ester esterase [Pseudoxanthomonas sp.]